MSLLHRHIGCWCGQKHSLSEVFAMNMQRAHDLAAAELLAGVADQGTEEDEE